MSSKKELILKMFDSCDWIKTDDGKETKYIKPTDFDKFGLNARLEYGQYYGDSVYVKRIIQKMGHKVILGGTVLYVIKDALKYQ